MAEHSPHGPQPTEPFDDRELRVRPILQVGIWTAVISAVAFVFVLFFYPFLIRMERAGDPPRSPIPEAAARPLPPEPRLQASPERDLAAYRAEQAARQTSYGWVDREAGVARIPVARAVDLLAERGLLAAPAVAAPGAGEVRP